MAEEYWVAAAVFGSAFGVAAFAGLASLLRTCPCRKPLSVLTVASAMLNSGFIGLAIALLWYQNFRHAENIYGLLGVCLLAGMAGSTVTDLLISLLTGAGIKVTIIHDVHDNHDSHDSINFGAKNDSSKNP